MRTRIDVLALAVLLALSLAAPSFAETSSSMSLRVSTSEGVLAQLEREIFGTQEQAGDSIEGWWWLGWCRYTCDVCSHSNDCPLFYGSPQPCDPICP